MKVFVSDDGYRLHLSHGMWGDGDLLFHDFNGNPVGFDGQEMDGVHVEVVVRDQTGIWGKRCLSHGVSVEYNSHGNYWHPMIAVDDLGTAISEVLVMMRTPGKDDRHERYRVVGCGCEGVVEVPFILEGC
jgi:hypothetical protein